MSDKKLMWISDGIQVFSGYGIQSAGILNGIKDIFSTTYEFSFQYFGQPITLNGITLVPNNPQDQWANQGTMKDRVNILKPDYIVTLMDLFRPCEWLKDQKNHLKQTGAKTIAYFPLDGQPLPWGSVYPTKVWEQFDYLVPMSYYGREVLLRELPELKDKVTEPIWHGLDTNTFKPILPKDNGFIQHSQDIFKGKKFVAISVFRNINRKNPQALIYAWYKFAKDKDDVLLLLHTNPKEPVFSGGTNIANLVHRLFGPNTNKVLFTGAPDFTFIQPPFFVNEIYNIGDIFVFPTSGEGFGIPIIEAMATGLPVVVTDYTTSRELLCDKEPEELIDTDLKFADRGCLLPFQFFPTNCLELTQRAQVNYNTMVTAFDWYYKTKKDVLKETYKKNREFVVQNFDWQVIIPKWREFFKKIGA